MNTNICGNCDYCDKTRRNDKGQLRCIRLRTYKNIDDCCSEYFNLKKEETYNELKERLRNGK